MKPQPGWRYFRCCGIEFRILTRDYTTPSIEVCPNCDHAMRPFKKEPDPTLKIDASWNLLADEWSEKPIK